MPLTNDQVRNHELYRLVVKEKEEQDESLKSLKKEFSELSEYLNKLESGYSQSLEYINHLEDIISHVRTPCILFCSVSSAARQEKKL